MSESERPGLHFATTLLCPACKTVIRYVDETPPWKESEARKKLLVEAELYLAEQGGEVRHALLRAAYFDSAAPEALAVAQDDAVWARLSPFWVQRYGWGVATAYAVRRDVDLRCIACPACAAEVFVEHAV